MKDAEQRVHEELRESVRHRRDGCGRATEWFLCTPERAREAVINVCMSINRQFLIDPEHNIGATREFVTRIFVGRHPMEEYTQRPEDANEGFAINKMTFGNLRL